MGQEILYCNKCGKRLVGDDFTRGRAHTFNNRQYCAGCLPRQHAAAPPAPIKAKPPTARTAPVRAPAKSSAMLWVGAGLGIAALGVIAVLLLNRPEEALPEPVPAGPSKEKVAQELKEVSDRVQKLVDAEQFGAAEAVLSEARKRYTVPEWDQVIGKRLKEIQDGPAGLYTSLKEKATAAQMRGAVAEAQKERARVVVWGRKDLVEDLDKALAAIIPRQPIPAGAKVLVRYPNGDPSRYRTTGQIKDGALVAVPDASNGVHVGWESGKEIFKVPEEGEIRVVYATTSPAVVTVILRAFGPDDKIHPYNHWVQKPEPGRIQTLKIPVTSLRDWSKGAIVTGKVVDNLFFRQDDKAAVLKVYEFVLYQTKP